MFYHDGVGTHGNPLKRILGAAIGLGLKRIVGDAYAFLAEKFVAGDEIYGKRPTTNLTQLTGCKPSRLMLHAAKISFTHPKTEKKLTLEAPCPEDFSYSLKALRVE